MELVAFVDDNQETLRQVAGLIKRGEWDQVVIIGNGIEKLSFEKK